MKQMSSYLSKQEDLRRKERTFHQRAQRQLVENQRRHARRQQHATRYYDNLANKCKHRFRQVFEAQRRIEGRPRVDSRAHEVTEVPAQPGMTMVEVMIITGDTTSDPHLVNTLSEQFRKGSLPSRHTTDDTTVCGQDKTRRYTSPAAFHCSSPSRYVRQMLRRSTRLGDDYMEQCLQDGHTSNTQQLHEQKENPHLLPPLRDAKHKSASSNQGFQGNNIDGETLRVSFPTLPKEKGGVGEEMGEAGEKKESLVLPKITFKRMSLDLVRRRWEHREEQAINRMRSLLYTWGKEEVAEVEGDEVTSKEEAEVCSLADDDLFNDLETSGFSESQPIEEVVEGDSEDKDVIYLNRKTLDVIILPGHVKRDSLPTDLIALAHKTVGDIMAVLREQALRGKLEGYGEWIEDGVLESENEEVDGDEGDEDDRRGSKRMYDVQQVEKILLGMASKQETFK